MKRTLHWEEIPQRYKYATKDAVGTWYLHTEYPEIDLEEGHWFSDDMYGAYWLNGNKPKLDWRKSLTERTAKAEHRKPTVDWSRVPAHFDWIATNEDHATFAYSDRPIPDDSRKGDGYWTTEPGQKCWWIDDAECKFRIGTCNWKSSLLERPDRKTRLKPSINWAVVPDKYRWLATDANGESWLYQTKPEIEDGNRWIDQVGAGCCPVTKRDDFFIGKLPWYESLTERPA